jgi:hypothetical protein
VYPCRETGEQADYALRHSLRRLGEAMEFTCRGLRRYVEPTARSDNETLLLGKAEVLACNSVGTEIARPEDSGRFSEFGNPCYRFCCGHYWVLLNVGDYPQVPAHELHIHTRF